MNKGQGLTAGALVVGAALLRSGSPGSLPQPDSAARNPPPITAPAGNSDKLAEGPWQASCKYWKLASAGRPSRRGSGKSPTAPETDLNLSGKDPDVTWKLHVSSTVTPSECNSAQWNIPAKPNPAITAIIATVPDPIHSSFALDFDRFMDVITQASADNGYLISYYWLPWNRPPETTRTTPSTADEQKEAQEREKQPGLILLRPDGFTQTSRLIYLFLVAQTPALGINGDQMSNALLYEAQLHDNKAVTAALSIRDQTHGADIIGPENSGSADSLKTALLHAPFPFVSTFHVTGITSTDKAVTTLQTADLPARAPASASASPRRSVPPPIAPPKTIDYISFGEDTGLEQHTIGSVFSTSAYGQSRLAFLVEAGTAYGTSLSGRKGASDQPITIQFPREISLLRNAQREDKTPTDAAAAVAAANPYLHLSLKNAGTEDTIAHLSPELTPFSQEAQWMSIVHELKERHIETVSISASNVLDALFLTQLLHRDMPDARVVLFDATDLLYTRSGDNAPYLGSLTVSAYPLLDLAPSLVTAGNLHNFASTWTKSFYNAVSYTLWDGSSTSTPSLTGYTRAPSTSQQASDSPPPTLRPPPLWMTVVGRDGHYPLSVLSRCSGANPRILPVINLPQSAAAPPSTATHGCTPSTQDPKQVLSTIFPDDRTSYPAFSWYFLCLVVTLLCLAHTLTLFIASFWSPTTRDLAIEHSDEPRRRAVYLHIATAMLLSMSVITALPFLTTFDLLHSEISSVAGIAAILTMLSGVLAAASTLFRTRHYCTRSDAEPQQVSCRGSQDQTPQPPRSDALYPWFNAVALLAAITVCGLWSYLCLNNTAPDHSNGLVGLFFSYRCLHPASGVSPLLPILILLASWYLWALLQTKRLRFSENSRPKLPGRLELGIPAPLHVSDDALSRFVSPVSSCLFDNITSLLITRQLVMRYFRNRNLSCPARVVNLTLAALYLLLFFLFVVHLPMQGLDHSLRQNLDHALRTLLDGRLGLHRNLSPQLHDLLSLNLTPYEFLISALFYPLLVIALTGCVRMIVIWTSLRGGLLEPLERSPLRFSFTRLTDIGWMTMLRQSGLHEYWRDMTRSNEAMQQISHHPALAQAANRYNAALWVEARRANWSLARHIATLLALLSSRDQSQAPPAAADFLHGADLPHPKYRAELNLMCAIECDYATFAEVLLESILVPFWRETRELPVEAEPAAAEARVSAAGVPPQIQLAEEFLAIRYLSLIRAVLINLRQLMTFVSAVFVLALLAWNSYPFQPRQWIDWAFTTLLFSLGTAIVWVFAQMHRNALLSRITGTQANELGGDFYLRLITFGAVPVLTWLASQFPAIGSGIYRFLQSGSQFAK